MCKLSVIIPTRNRSRELHNALVSITSQQIDQKLFEVIVVDNGSTDNTREIVCAFEKTFPNLRYFYEERPGLHNGRHRGLKEAFGEILVFCDDDIIATKTWLSAIEESFQDSDVALVGGNNFPNFEVEPPQWIHDLWDRPRSSGGRYLEWFSILDFGVESKTIDPMLIWGCNFSIRKKILLEAGGFNPDGLPQELIMYRGDGETKVSQFVHKSGYKSVFNPNASVYHLVSKSRMTIDYLKTRNFNDGISASFSYIRAARVTRYRLIIGLNKSLIVAVIKLILLYLPIYAKRDITKSLSISYFRGYLFHHWKFITCRDLRRWVRKSSFMDDDILFCIK